MLAEANDGGPKKPETQAEQSRIFEPRNVFPRLAARASRSSVPIAAPSKLATMAFDAALTLDYARGRQTLEEYQAYSRHAPRLLPPLIRQ